MHVDKQSLLRERTKEEVQAFIDAHPEVQRWLRKIPSALTKNNYAHDLMRYVQATGYSPAQLIALKQKAKKDEHPAEDLLDEFVDLAEKATIGDARIWNLTIAVKSFYKWNYADLSRGAGKKTVTKKKAYRTPDKESLLKFMEGSNLRDKALIHFIASTGIAEGSIPYLTWGHLWKELIEKRIDPPHIGLTSVEIKGKGQEKYAGVQQHTFLTSTAVEALLRYKEWRERVKGEKITPESPLFATIEGPIKPLTVPSVRNIFLDTSKRSGVNFSPHDLRRFVQTQLEFARMQPNWIKKILRHKVKGEEDPYSQPKIEQLRTAYREAIPHLDLGATPLIELKKRQEASERITAKVMAGEPLTQEDQEDVKRFGFRVGRRRERMTDGGMPCEDGEHCGAQAHEFKQIHESELLIHLQEGFVIVHKLSTGDLIVKR